VEIGANKPFTHRFNKAKGKLHVTQASFASPEYHFDRIKPHARCACPLETTITHSKLTHKESQDEVLSDMGAF
ncbi:hypothetical protein C5167_005084, partial [Papaver somniferum]